MQAGTDYYINIKMYTSARHADVLRIVQHDDQLDQAQLIR